MNKCKHRETGELFNYRILFSDGSMIAVEKYGDLRALMTREVFEKLYEAIL